ncbi:hypothetical protein [Moraxella bovis]|uniref:Uncharacterized protein n=1 Tax=Moraxella bovis TaxID=476 RepID=A0A378PSL3_MORBO|nr:hypothetical protein [Moraxella bovis]UYZ76527.1 hypothetical protein LP093_04255 [Moraxella bovis]UYZ77521.1 hypothetical protein LP115_09555 [Moraxella bovis]UYZ81978.1 hypothetical protein LP113_04455 [Moraxella bovis]UYZ86007.1 hypothetical protein LP094_09605 [Moraxella bovis]UYZ91440.1 hypothetical protein LP103_09660 [Moraxella bovis]
MPILEFGGMIFEWYDPKYELVLNKHKITFEEVVSVFADFIVPLNLKILVITMNKEQSSLL